jgi:phage terminase large subunit
VLLARGVAKRERILCAREVQKSIAGSSHKLLSDLIAALGLGDFYTVQQTGIFGKNGTEFSFHGLSSETRDSLKSQEGTTICWVEEAQTISGRSLDILEPTIRAPDSELWFSFNPIMDSDEVYKRFVVDPPPNALVGKIGWEDNPWRSEVLDAARERMAREEPEKFANIYGGECAPAVEGAIYHREMVAAIESGRIRPVPYDPLLKVHTVWDLGWRDSTSILLVQRSASEVRVIDFIERSHSTYADDVAELERRRYRWGVDWLPHDGRAENKQTGKSPKETLIALGRRVEIVKDIGVEAGIASARMLFPRVYFDEVNCKPLLDHLKRYKRKVNAEGLVGDPDHDEHSHAADAFRYLAVVVDRLRNDERDATPVRPTTKYIV